MKDSGTAGERKTAAGLVYSRERKIGLCSDGGHGESRKKERSTGSQLRSQ